MKTTLNLDDELLKAVKKTAAERGITMTQVIEEALRSALTGPPVQGTPFRWRIVEGRRVPDFDIADRDALYDRMEARP